MSNVDCVFCDAVGFDGLFGDREWSATFEAEPHEHIVDPGIQEAGPILYVGRQTSYAHWKRQAQLAGREDLLRRLVYISRPEQVHGYRDVSVLVPDPSWPSPEMWQNLAVATGGRVRGQIPVTPRSEVQPITEEEMAEVRRSLGVKDE